MVDHIVLLALRSSSHEGELSHLRRLLTELPGRIDGIEAVRSGSSSSPEGLEQGYGYAFVITFTDELARDRYLPHPDHAPLSALVQQIAERVLVFDITS